MHVEEDKVIKQKIGMVKNGVDEEKERKVVGKGEGPEDFNQLSIVPK